jgi:hypothetical protein
MPVEKEVYFIKKLQKKDNIQHTHIEFEHNTSYGPNITRLGPTEFLIKVIIKEKFKEHSIRFLRRRKNRIKRNLVSLPERDNAALKRLCCGARGRTWPSRDL